MADQNSVTLITMINQLNDLLKDVASSSENLEDGQLENQTSPEEKALQRKLIEIHLRLKCATNYSSDEDEEAFFEDVTVCNFVATIRPDDGQADAGEQGVEEEGLTIHGVPISFGKVCIQKMVELLKCCKIIFGELYDFESTPRKLKFSDDTHAMATQLLAELARSVSGRYLMIREGIVGAVSLLLLENVAESLDEEVQRCNENSTLCSVETAVQICRVLGNLCYDSTEGCIEIEKQEHLIPRLAILAQSRASRLQEDPGQRLPVVLPGFLANLIYCSDSAMNKVGENGLIDVLLSYILSTKTNDAVFSACIKFFTDAMSDPEVTPYILKAEKFSDAWTHILENTTSAEILTSLLRANIVIKNAQIALHLLKNFKILDILLSEVMGRWNTSDDYQELRQDAFRSVIELLRFPECVTHIYKETGDKYPNIFTSWLLKIDDQEAVCTGADALKYFAAEEIICMELISKPNNFVDYIIEILTTSPGRTLPSSLLYRILNPISLVAHYQKVRPYLINKGLPSIISNLFLNSYVDVFANFIHTFIFIIMRLLTNGSSETTHFFITAHNKALLRKSITLVNDNTFPGHLRINGPRFFAALLKNCRSVSHFKILIEEGTLAIINADLLFNEKILYVNEALLGLSVASAALTTGPCDETDENALLIHRHLHMDLVINGIKRILQEQDPLKIPVEIKLNAIAFLEFLLKANRDAFLKMLQDMHFIEDCLNEDSLSKLPQKFTEFAQSIKN